MARLRMDGRSKDGQIAVLRDRLTRAAAERSTEKQGTLRYLEQAAVERSRREAELAQSNTTQEARLQFQDKARGKDCVPEGSFPKRPFSKRPFSNQS